MADDSVIFVETLDPIAKLVTTVRRAKTPDFTPVVDTEASYQMSAAQTASLQTDANRYEQLQVAERNAKVKGDKATANKLLGERTTVSRDLGIKGADFVAENHFNLPQQGYVKICCSGPTSGGGATGVFDDVWWNAADNKVVILEAKGGKTYYSVASKRGAGRSLTINNQEFFALQGTPQYIDEIIRLMSQSSNPDLVLAAQKLQFARTQNLLSYHFVSSTWWDGAGRLARGSQLVKRAAPEIRVTTVKLQ
jgi:hypothetical protein